MEKFQFNWIPVNWNAPMVKIMVFNCRITYLSCLEEESHVLYLVIKAKNEWYAYEKIRAMFDEWNKIKNIHFSDNNTGEMICIMSFFN